MPLVYASPDSESQFAFDILEDAPYGAPWGRRRRKRRRKNRQVARRGRKMRGQQQQSREKMPNPLKNPRAFAMWARRHPRAFQWWAQKHPEKHAQWQALMGQAQAQHRSNAWENRPQLFSNDPLATGFEASSFPSESNEEALVSDYDDDYSGMYGAFGAWGVTLIAAETRGQRRRRLRRERRRARRAARKGKRQARRGGRKERRAERKERRVLRREERREARHAPKQSRKFPAWAYRKKQPKWLSMQVHGWARMSPKQRYAYVQMRTGAGQVPRPRSSGRMGPARMVRQQGPTWPPQGWEAPPGVEEGAMIEEEAMVAALPVEAAQPDWAKWLLWGGLGVGAIFGVKALMGKKKGGRGGAPRKAPAKPPLASRPVVGA